MRLAAKNDISPCLLARIILEEYYWNDVEHGRAHERSEGRGSLPPGFMTDCIRDIAKLPNPELAMEIYETMMLDNFYGPAVDSIKKSCGVEYEVILKARCQEAGLSFIDESQMREEGYDKTPDIRLKVPIMINKRVVNWIESKASFGDPINHQQYMIDQYLPYKNRFGPGAVIYWFGFVQELAETGERGILLLNGFPVKEQIVHLQDMHQQERDSVGFSSAHKINTNDNSSGFDDLEMDGKFSSYVDPIFDSDEEEDQTPGFTAVVQGSCVISSITAEGTLEKHDRMIKLGLMDTDIVRSTGYSLHGSGTDNCCKSQSSSCVTSGKSDNTDTDKNSEAPRSYSDHSVSLVEKDNYDNSVPDIASDSDNRLSSHRNTSSCEKVDEHWSNKATNTFCVDKEMGDVQNLHQHETGASCNKLHETQDNSISLHSVSVAPNVSTMPCSADHSVDCIENSFLFDSSSSPISMNSNLLSPDKEVRNKSLSFIYSDKKKKKRKPKRGER
ncbi:unnamed protein product [Candidula unifasciata]|uniref:CDAN1-interacting nuclease 1 n=1 Tax=Candidula unifasciata TaxID=100452 RepID=A0A8S3Z5F2_9EUPU|nr:unnamed protein product [Candidula unifasciata]